MRKKIDSRLADTRRIKSSGNVFVDLGFDPAEAEVMATVETGEQFPAKFGRTGFRRNFAFGGEWLGRRHATKQVEAYAVIEQGDWLVITVVVKFF